MKRSKMLIEMQKVYGIRHVMVENQYITLETFMDEMLQHLENLGMLPPKTMANGHELHIKPFLQHVWEKEE